MSRCRHRIAAPPATALRASVGWRSEAATGSDLSGRGTAVARSDPMAPRSGFGLHRFAVATAGATLVLLFLGGLVTSTGSGLAVPDWPLSFGQVFPPMVGGVLFEHGHRLAATAVGCLTVVLALWTVVGEARASVRALGLLALLAVALPAVHVRRHTDDPWVRRPALLAGGLVVLQVTLGALTIWSRRAVLVTTTHLVVGAALLATCLVLTLRATHVTLIQPRTVDPVGVRRGALA